MNNNEDIIEEMTQVAAGSAPGGQINQNELE